MNYLNLLKHSLRVFNGGPAGDERGSGTEPGGRSASEVVASAVRQAAFARMAALGPHLIALVVKLASPVTLAPDSTG
jgi:hypothetical protein